MCRPRLATSVALPFFKDILIDLGVFFAVFGSIVIVAAGNAVNLTDGLDGLAAGSAIFVFSAYVIIGYWIFRHPGMYQINVGLDLAVVAAVGAPALIDRGGPERLGGGGGTPPTACSIPT